MQGLRSQHLLDDGLGPLVGISIVVSYHPLTLPWPRESKRTRSKVRPCPKSEGWGHDPSAPENRCA